MYFNIAKALPDRPESSGDEERVNMQTYDDKEVPDTNVFMTHSMLTWIRGW